VFDAIQMLLRTYMYCVQYTLETYVCFFWFRILILRHVTCDGIFEAGRPQTCASAFPGVLPQKSDSTVFHYKADQLFQNLRT
jgi:hypothetical protein